MEEVIHHTIHGRAGPGQEGDHSDACDNPADGDDSASHIFTERHSTGTDGARGRVAVQ